MTKLAQPQLTRVKLPLEILYSEGALTADISGKNGSRRSSSASEGSEMPVVFVDIYKHRNVRSDDLIFRLRTQLFLNGYLRDVRIGKFENLTIELRRGSFLNDSGRATFTAEPRFQIKTDDGLEDRILPGFTLAESGEEITPEKEREKLAKYMGRTLMAPFRQYAIPGRNELTLASLWDIRETNCSADSLKNYLKMFRETARNLSLTYPTGSTDETRILSASKFVVYSLRRMRRLAERIERGEFSDWQIPVTEKSEGSAVGKLAKAFRIV